MHPTVGRKALITVAIVAILAAASPLHAIACWRTAPTWNAKSAPAPSPTPDGPYLNGNIQDNPIAPTPLPGSVKPISGWRSYPPPSYATPNPRTVSQGIAAAQKNGVLPSSADPCP